MRLLGSRSLGRGRIGIEADLQGLRVKTLRELEAALPNGSFVDATDLVYRIRAVKSAREIEYHRKAAEITSQGMREALAAVAPGRTENEIAGIAAKAMFDAGSEFFTIQPVVASGYRCAFNHTHAYRRRFEQGDVVLLSADCIGVRAVMVLPVFEAGAEVVMLLDPRRRRPTPTSTAEADLSARWDLSLDDHDRHPQVNGSERPSQVSFVHHTAAPARAPSATAFRNMRGARPSPTTCSSSSGRAARNSSLNQVSATR